ncbi:MAG TPA: FtsX-like permease family protein [Bacteroidota bacterium]|nr:FtsX-like permease family protein [Bacteroidota bacterium]
MKLEQAIALRYLKSKRKVGFVTVISFISIVGVTIGVAALVIVLSVFNGFNGLVTSILTEFDPHLRVERLSPGDQADYDRLSFFLSSDSDVQGFAPFVSGKALIVSRNMNRVINVKGLDETLVDKVSGLRDKLVLGELDFQARNGSGMVIGLTLADRLGVVVGDTLSVVSPAGSEFALLQIGQPLIRRFVVSGIYESNNKEYDAYYAYVGLDAGRALFSLGNQVQGVEIRLSDIDVTSQFEGRMRTNFGSDYRILTWYDLHRELYSVMQIERWMAYVILCMIVGVASFNLLGSLTMSVIEKTRDIGILKTMGATREMIQKIFMNQGLFVGILGSLFGVLLGVLVVYLQQEFHLVPLDPTVYIIPAIPVELHVMDLILVSLTGIGLCSVAAYYPARRAAALVPVEAIRWE